MQPKTQEYVQKTANAADVNSINYAENNPEGLEDPPGATAVLNLAYNFSYGAGDNGNVVGITNGRDATRSQSFTYDSLNRITAAQSAATSGHNCWGEGYGYDAWGNLSTRNVTNCAGETQRRFARPEAGGSADLRRRYESSQRPALGNCCYLG